MKGEAEDHQRRPGARSGPPSALLRGNDPLSLALAGKDVQIKKLIQIMSQAQDAEREQLCLEVHDGVTQTLVSAFQYLQALRKAIEEETPTSSPSRSLATKATALVRQAIQEAREVVERLEPAALRDLGLASTLSQKLKDLEVETGCKVKFRSDPFHLPRATEVALYRILYEAITNVRKHARSPRLEVEIKYTPGWLRIRVQDWGVGFVPNPTSGLSPQGGIGLFSMAKRAELLGGTCQVSSIPRQGTTVLVEVPLPEDKEGR